MFADPHVVARGVVREMAHGSGETVKVIANPVRLSETPADYRLPPPVLGEHTDAVLRDRLASAPPRSPACGRRAWSEASDGESATGEHRDDVPPASALPSISRAAVRRGGAVLSRPIPAERAARGAARCPWRSAHSPRAAGGRHKSAAR